MFIPVFIILSFRALRITLPVSLITGATLKNLAIFEGIHLKSISVSLKEIIASSAKVVRVRNFVKFDQAKGSSVKRILRAVKSNFYISTFSFKKKNTHGNFYIGQGFSVREIRNYVSHAQSTNMENVNSSIKKTSKFTQKFVNGRRS